MVFVRPGELRAAEWKEFDLDAGEWRIGAERMKMRAQHIVPLSRQARCDLARHAAGDRHRPLRVPEPADREAAAVR